MSDTSEELEEDDLLFLFGEGEFEVDDDDADEHAVLHTLSRRISGQYIEVLATFAAQAFAGHATPAHRDQVHAAVSALSRLAEASHDASLLGILNQLEALLPSSQVTTTGRRRRFIADLKEWVLAFSALLSDEDAERMHRLVSFDNHALPLLDELAAIKGIGPKRLERLYFAGLFSVEVVCAAEPADVAAVTALPLHLAEEVVRASVEFAHRQRVDCAQALYQRTSEISTLLKNFDPSRKDDRKLLDAARQAMEELQAALSSLDTVIPENSK